MEREKTLNPAPLGPENHLPFCTKGEICRRGMLQFQVGSEYDAGGRAGVGPV